MTCGIEEIQGVDTKPFFALKESFASLGKALPLSIRSSALKRKRIRAGEETRNSPNKEGKTKSEDRTRRKEMKKKNRETKKTKQEEKAGKLLRVEPTECTKTFSLWVLTTGTPPHTLGNIRGSKRNEGETATGRST